MGKLATNYDTTLARFFGWLAHASLVLIGVAEFGHVLGVIQRVFVVRLWKLITPVSWVVAGVLLPYIPQVIDESLVKEEQWVGRGYIGAPVGSTYRIVDGTIRSVLKARSETLRSVGITFHILLGKTITVGCGAPAVVTVHGLSDDVDLA